MIRTKLQYDLNKSLLDKSKKQRHHNNSQFSRLNLKEEAVLFTGYGLIPDIHKVLDLKWEL